MKAADLGELFALAALWGASFLLMRLSAGEFGPIALVAVRVAAVLAFACTGLAYLIYFRLIAHVGPANAIAVTFLIPAFAIVWGWMFLGEGVTTRMVGGCALIILGTALATGLLKWPVRRSEVLARR